MKWKSFHAAKTICFETAVLGTEAKITFKASNTKLHMKVMEPATDKAMGKTQLHYVSKLKNHVESDMGNESFQWYI